MINKFLQCKILLIAIFIFGILSIVVYIPSESEVIVPEEVIHSVTDMSVASIRAIAVSNESGVFGLINSPEGVTVATAEQKSFNATIINSYIYGLSKLKAKQLIDGNADDFGLANPLSQITIIDSEGLQREFVLLSKAAVSDDYYLLSVQENQIFLVDESQASLFLSSVLDFVSIEIMPFFDFQNVQLLESMTITHNNSVQYSIVNNGEMNFSLTSPLSAKIDTVSLFESVLFPLASINNVRALEEAPSIQSKESYIVEVLAQKLYKAQLFFEEETVYVYDGSTWYLSQEITTDFLSISYLELLNNVAYNMNIASLEYIEINYSDENNYFIQISGSGQTLEATYNNNTFDYIKTGNILRPIHSMKISQILQNKNFNNPLVSITLKFKNGSSDIIEISDRQQDGEFYIKVNDIINFSTSELYIHDILNIATMLREG